MTGNEERKIGSLRDLPLDIAPSRDLWQGIEARIAAERVAAERGSAERGSAERGSAERGSAERGSAEQGRVQSGAGVGGVGVKGAGVVGAGWRAGEALVRRRSARWMRVLAAAAVIAALAVGIWIGRAVLPVGGKAPAGGAELDASNVSRSTGEPGAWHAAYIMDSKYTRQRAELVKDLSKRLAALPPESRTKVLSSLQTINDSKRALEAELGKDPSNALLQELLVNTYQDEMRVLNAVHEAAGGGEGI